LTVALCLVPLHIDGKPTTFQHVLNEVRAEAQGIVEFEKLISRNPGKVVSGRNPNPARF
jgi:hypothetical protein